MGHLFALEYLVEPDIWVIFLPWNTLLSRVTDIWVIFLPWNTLLSRVTDIWVIFLPWNTLLSRVTDIWGHLFLCILIICGM